MSFRQKGFIPYNVVVFFNAFVDLGHKIVIQNAIFKSYDGPQQVVLTAIVNGLILLPFILLFSPSGFLADRFPKHHIIRYSAVVAIAATLAITFCYYQGWFRAAFALTFALAVQSAIYSPSKYGYIKELVGNSNLAAANGIVQAVTIAGILLGTFFFSILFEALLSGVPAASPGRIMTAVAPIGWLLVALSVMEWLTSTLLPARHPGNTAETFELRRYLALEYLSRNLRVLNRSNAIWLSIIGLATFWAVSQVMLAAFPAFAKEVLSVTNTVVIQGILACSGVGIVLGSLFAGRVSRDYIETGLIPVGALGIALGLALLPTLDSAFSMGLTFLLVGAMGGMFIVPLNALIQFHAPGEHLGTVLAGNNWVQNVAMLGALGCTVGVSLAGIDSTGLLYLLTFVAVAGTGYTLCKLPQSLVRILLIGMLRGRWRRLEVIGFDNVPRAGPALLLGNHGSTVDWALVQIACPRPVRFLMPRKLYDTRYLKPFFRALGAVPLAGGEEGERVRTINTLLQAGECVCLLLEGANVRDGYRGRPHASLESVSGGTIIPFYLHGLTGGSRSSGEEGAGRAHRTDHHNNLVVAFGPPLPAGTPAARIERALCELSTTA